MVAGLRLVVLTPFALMLCDCNQVVSDEPWFTEADAQGVPQLRDGLWLASDPDCRFDETRPAERWPDCASAFVVRGKEWLEADWDTQGEGKRARRTFAKWKVLPVLFAGGEPAILQVKSEGDPNRLRPDAAPTAAAGAYSYYAIRPLRIDDADRITQFETWPVQCGPRADAEPPRAHTSGGHHADDAEWASDHRNVTDKPFSGLTVVDNNCIAESKDALRIAARLSETLSEKPMSQMHWVRDGFR